MSRAIRVTVEFETPDGCPIARVSERTGETVNSVSTSVVGPDDDGSVTEFYLDGDFSGVEGARNVFSDGTTNLYRVSHDQGPTCPCECLGSYDCPVDSYVSRGGTLRIGFYATDFDQLRSVIEEFGERWPSLDVRQMIREPLHDAATDVVFVDRAKLTERQYEVLATAYEMGYFERPRGANASDVAEEFDVDPSTVAEHLAAAQSKLLGDVLDD